MKVYFISEKCGKRLSVKAYDAESLSFALKPLEPFIEDLIKVDMLGFFIHKFGFYRLGARFKL